MDFSQIESQSSLKIDVFMKNFFCLIAKILCVN